MPAKRKGKTTGIGEDKMEQYGHIIKTLKLVVLPLHSKGRFLQYIAVIVN